MTNAFLKHSLLKGDDILDREFRQSYFKQLVGQFATIGGEINDPETRKHAAEIASQKPEAVAWDDIYQLELDLIKLEPEQQLRRHASLLRGEYKKVAATDYETYEDSKFPDAENDPPEKLRADLVQVQKELNWYYTVLWVQETFRSILVKRVTRITVCWIVTYCLVAAAFMASTSFVLHLKRADSAANQPGNGHVEGTGISNSGSAITVVTSSSSQVSSNSAPLSDQNQTNRDAIPVAGAMSPQAIHHQWWKDVTNIVHIAFTYWLVAFSGTLGALISVLRRIQNMSLDGNTDKNLVDLEQGSTSIDYSPLLGAVFALLLLFLFMGQLLSGSLFPSSPTDSNAGSFLSCVPVGCTNLAKLVIWCFLAGFAERLVPDALDKLQSQAASVKKSAPSSI